MSRLIPIVIALVAIAALTVVEGTMSERWGDNRLCAYCTTLLDDVPSQIGSWTGTDGEVDDKTREVAGARGYVSRSYTNSATDKRVGVWLIVGHARDTARHTPDICYPYNGFKKTESISKHRLTLPDGRVADFFTTIWGKQNAAGQQLERVYWAWFKPRGNSGNPVSWVAPDNVRMEIAAAPALFKLYFTTSGDDAELPHNEGPCMKFAQEFLSTVDPILQSANGPIPDDFDASTVESI